MASEVLCQTPLVALPHDNFCSMQRILAHKLPPFVPRLQYSLAQKQKLEKTAAKITEFPYTLHRAASWLRALAAGQSTFWSPVPDVIRIVDIPAHNMAPIDLVGGSMLRVSPNIIEPTNEARRVSVLPAKGKFERKQRKGRGAMSARRPTPAPLLPESQSVVIEEIHEDGDIHGIVSDMVQHGRPDDFDLVGGGS